MGERIGWSVLGVCVCVGGRISVCVFVWGGGNNSICSVCGREEKCVWGGGGPIVFAVCVGGRRSVCGGGGGEQ